MSLESIEGALALVTGAGSGIGEATARRLAARGAKVICAGRRLERLQAVAASLASEGLALAVDVTDAAAVAALPGCLPEGWREVDILVNSAGHDVGGRAPFVDGGAEQWTAIVETNVNGLIRVTRAFLAGMIERDRGHVVNIGSLAGVRPYPGGGAYVASKFAVRGLTECLRLDCRDSAVRVSEILPGLVRTEFAERRWGDARRAEAFYDAAGHALEPDDVAGAVMYALEQPPHVVIAQVMVLPKNQ